MKTHRLKIKKKENISDNATIFTLEIPKELKSVFHYVCGQYLTAILNIDGRKIGRGYSIASCPYTDQDMEFAVKKIPRGKTSVYVVDSLKEGDFLEVTTPQGHFFDTSENIESLHYVLIGAGSGITPLFSILKTVLIENKDNKATLFYGNRFEEDIIFKKELDSLEEKYKNRLFVTHFLSQASNKWEGRRGRISEEDIKEMVEDLKTKILPMTFYICGPEIMMKTAQKTILDCGIEEKRIHIEWYHAPHPTEPKKELSDHHSKTLLDSESVFIGTGEPSLSPETLVAFLDGEEVKVNAKKDMNILETFLNEGYSPPFSCMAGACTSCAAIVEEGLVKQDEQAILTDSDINEKKALTCQAVPYSKTVKLKFLYDE